MNIIGDEINKSFDRIKYNDSMGELLNHHSVGLPLIFSPIRMLVDIGLDKYSIALCALLVNVYLNFVCYLVKMVMLLLVGRIGQLKRCDPSG